LYIECDNFDAAFHFSVEEYFTQYASSQEHSGEYFCEPIIMIWQTGKCVMLGSYQTAEAEINLQFARENGIQVVRRCSGGGTIFTDSGTLLYTMILPNLKEQYPQQTSKEILAASVVDLLNKTGISARQEGRNDITVDGKKVSGMAQYVRNNRVCSHCSLLYDTNLEMLTQVLHVDQEKIQSKAIRSIRSRVTNLKNYMSAPLSTQDFKELIKQNLFKKYDITKYNLTENDIARINKIYHEKYANPSWTYGRSPKFSFRNTKRFQGGRVEIFLDIANGIIDSCSIRGDFLGTVPIRTLEELLENKSFQYKAVDDVLYQVDLTSYFGDITKEQFLSCMFD